MEMEEAYGYCMHDGATAHITIYSINVLNEVSEYRLISCKFWPVRSPHLNSCDCYPW